MLKVEKLNEKFLEDVAGGITGEKYSNMVRTATSISMYVAPLVGISSVGCGIASCIYFAKANKAKNSSNVSDYNKYIKKAQNCAIATTSLAGATTLAASSATITIFGLAPFVDPALVDIVTPTNDKN